MLSWLVGRTLFGVTVTPFLATLAGIFMSALGVLAIVGSIYFAGVSSERGKCEAAALKMQLAARALEAKLANERAERAEKAIRGFVILGQEAQARIGELADELSKAKLQSTQPGAKGDPNALLDDRCNYTPAGSARDRGMRR